MLVTLLSAFVVLGILGVVFGFISAYGPGMSVDESGHDAGGRNPSHGAGCGACGAGSCGPVHASEEKGDLPESGDRAVGNTLHRLPRAG